VWRHRATFLFSHAAGTRKVRHFLPLPLPPSPPGPNVSAFIPSAIRSRGATNFPFLCVLDYFYGTGPQHALRFSLRATLRKGKMVLLLFLLSFPLYLMSFPKGEIRNIVLIGYGFPSPSASGDSYNDVTVIFFVILCVEDAMIPEFLFPETCEIQFLLFLPLLFWLGNIRGSTSPFFLNERHAGTFRLSLFVSSLFLFLIAGTGMNVTSLAFSSRRTGPEEMPPPLFLLPSFFWERYSAACGLFSFWLHRIAPLSFSLSPFS